METLREISNEYQNVLYEALNEEEISDQVWESLKNLDSKFDKKVENLAYVSSEIKTRCKNINEGIDRLNSRFHRWAKNLKSISEYIKNEMIATGKKKVDTELYTVSLRKSEVCEIDPEFIEEAKTQNLNNLLRIIPEKIEADKVAVKEYINSGKTLNHARITEKQNLNIR